MCLSGHPGLPSAKITEKPKSGFDRSWKKALDKEKSKRFFFLLFSFTFSWIPFVKILKAG
jgi:hypothetical protein